VVVFRHAALAVVSVAMALALISVVMGHAALVLIGVAMGLA
jgi:hypothetical protein